MTIEQFKYLFGDEVDANGFYLIPEEEVFVFRKPLSIWESQTGYEVVFDSIEEFLDFEYRGRLIREYIEDLDTLSISLNGSTGADKTFKFGHAPHGNDPDMSKSLFPAYANVRIKSKTLEGAMQEFHDRFENEDHEWAYEVDPQGYVHQYIEGNATSVSIMKKALSQVVKTEIIFSRKMAGILKQLNLLKQLKPQRCRARVMMMQLTSG